MKAAAELGLLKGTPVGTSLIDAHAGGLGMIGCYASDVSSNFSNRLGMQDTIDDMCIAQLKRKTINLLWLVISSFDLRHFNLSHDSEREQDIREWCLGPVLQRDGTRVLA